MTIPALTYSDDQAAAFDSVTDMLRHAGIDLDDSLLMPPAGGADQVMAVTGKAGSGKTMLLAELYKALEAAGVEIVSGDYESRKRKEKRTLAILAPTNKAASVLRLRPPLVCGAVISLRGGNVAKNRWTSVSSTKVRCWMTSSSKT